MESLLAAGAASLLLPQLATLTDTLNGWVLSAPKAYHHIVNLTPHDDDDDGGGDGDVVPYDVTGNICESGDLFARGRPLQRLREGDFLDIQNAGAYCRSMASEYNLRSMPSEVVLHDVDLAEGGEEGDDHNDDAVVAVATRVFARYSSVDLMKKFLQEYGAHVTY